MGNIYISPVVDYTVGAKAMKERFQLSAAYLSNRDDAVAFVEARG